MKIVFRHWPEFFRAVLTVFGITFLVLEATEVLTDINLKLPPLYALLIGIVPGVAYFYFDGFFGSGFLKREITIPSPIAGSTIKIVFGDIFSEQGWKVISASDFFDSVVDEDLVSSRSLHGKVLQTYWSEQRADWDSQIQSSLRHIAGQVESRRKGKRTRYAVGTVARAIKGENKFLFVALGRTNATTNVVNSNAEMLVCAVRSVLVEARSACSREPLIIPLMGSVLGRVKASRSVILDLIVAAIVEESQNGRITDEIKIILYDDPSDEINLQQHKRNWANG